MLLKPLILNKSEVYSFYGKVNFQLSKFVDWSGELV